MKLNARNITSYAVLIALSLLLSFIESQLPPAFISVPGVKLGLANIITLLTLYMYGSLPAVTVVFCRCLLASFFGGGFSAFLFSVTGGLISVAVMIFLKKRKHLSVYGVSVGGAAAHGIGQIIVASVMFLSFSVYLYLPLLLISSLVTGTITALLAAILLTRIKNLV